jgi:glutathione S-transferase
MFIFLYWQIPLLYWDGEVIAQSMAIARFLARELGLAGKKASSNDDFHILLRLKLYFFHHEGRNNLECAQVDEIIDTLQVYVN